MNNILELLQVEPAETYHSKAVEYLSSHQLIDYMRCPYLHMKKRSGLIQRKESSAFFIGRAAHCRILEGRDVYEAEFAVGGPINPRTMKPFGEKTKAFEKWAVEQGKPVISNDTAELIEQMAAGVVMNPTAQELLEKGQAEGVLREDYCGVYCQCRYDWLNPSRGIVDLKTCDQLDWFEADARRWNYAHQMAFYQGVMHAAVGQYLSVHLIAIEKKEPYRCGVWRLSDDTLSIARAEVESAIERYKTSRKADEWPTGYEEVRIMDI
jgi:hypothetical protein